MEEKVKRQAQQHLKDIEQLPSSYTMLNKNAITR